MPVISFKNIRIVFLLIVLAIAAIYTKEQRLQTTSWFKPITVVIFPINGDGSAKTAQYIKSLSEKSFQDIDLFFKLGAKQYQLISQTPIITSLGDSIESHPPAPPENRNSIVSAILWSMKLRYWAYKNTPDDISNKDRIRLYVLYHQGKENQALEHSLGLQKGLIGVVHAYASTKQNKQNSFVMTHEILHTVGASDKYDYRNNQPIYPEGYVKPEQLPLYPQRYAEIMAGRIPLSNTQSTMPKDLRFSQVGHKTAIELNWINVP